VSLFICCYTGFHYAECRYTECGGACNLAECHNTALLQFLQFLQFLQYLNNFNCANKTPHFTKYICNPTDGSCEGVSKSNTNG